MTVLGLIASLVKLLVELWPILKDWFTEDPEEFDASLREVVAELRRTKKTAPKEARRAAARKAAREFADHIKRI